MKEHPLTWKFRRIFANLAVPLRTEVVAIVDGEPLSFRVIYNEIEHNTEAGYKAIGFMSSVGLLD